MEHLLSAIEGKASIASFQAPKKRSNSRILVALAIVFFLLSFVVWTQRNTEFDEEGLELLASQSSFEFYLQGMEYVQRWDKGDNLESAISAYTRAIELDPDFALAYAKLAEPLRIQSILTGDDSKLEEAIQNVDMALGLNPNLAPVQVSLARVNYTRGNTDIAFAAIEAALSLDQNDAEANQMMANILQRQGRTEEAESYFQRAIALAPENLLILDSYANFLILLGNFEAAAEQWQTVIRLAPDHYAALVNLGSALNGLNRVDEAVSMYLRALDIRPSYTGYMNLGNAYSHAENYQEAIRAYRQAIVLNDSDWLVWGNLASMLVWQSGMTEEAEQTNERAIRLAEESRESNSRDPWVHSDLARYYARAGQRELAQQRLETALALAPEVGAISAAVAEAYELMGDRDKAVEYILLSIDQGFPAQQLKQGIDVKELFLDSRLQGI